jgi:hypothetical protein
MNLASLLRDLRAGLAWRGCSRDRKNPVCTENLICVDEVMESPKLAE